MSRAGKTVQKQFEVVELVLGLTLGLGVVTYFYTVFGAVLGFTPTSGSLFFLPSWLPIVGGIGPVHHELWGLLSIGLGFGLIVKGGPFSRLFGFLFIGMGAAWFLDDYYLHCGQFAFVCQNWP